MDPDKRYHLPSVVKPGHAGIALKLDYLTLEKQMSVSNKYMTAIRQEEGRPDYRGSSITPQILDYEIDYALAQLRAAARLHLSDEPDRCHLLLKLDIPASQFQGSYNMHWDDLVASVRCSTFAQNIEINCTSIGHYHCGHASSGRCSSFI
jgi:hypothetical protein